MRGHFDPDNSMMTFFGKVMNLLAVNILWVLCSIPIVTIGAATTALYDICFQIIDDEEAYVFRSYFKSLKENFKQATMIWLSILLAAVILVLDFYTIISRSMAGTPLGMIMLCVFLFLGIVLVSMLIYVFAIQSYFENTMKNTIKNAIIFGFVFLSFYFSGRCDLVQCNDDAKNFQKI